MIAWMVRGLLLGALIVALRVALGFAMANWPTNGVWFRLLCLLVLLGAVVAWGMLDGRRDREAHPDPERGSDLTIRWLQAAALGGIGSSAVCWLLDFLPGFDLGDNGMLFELTACSAFFLLLIFVPGLAGIGLGRMLAGRSAEKRDAAARPAAVGA
ncbi:MAG TPA: B-4DMT family transporter [Nocardia sp.]|uniref:B-4DMT family transporter n=1 Tax=Nocardia TaxID=1817 RepID=UPI002454C643|nr:MULTISPECIES: B-4DMT family transporter [Nocardia]HLS75241.1 B-4DMT family transporter [Nocardia sp.]